MAKNYRFDSVAFQKEVEDIQRKQNRRSRMFEEVFGDTSRNVRKKGGVLKEALRILSNPSKALSEYQRRLKKAKARK